MTTEIAIMNKSAVVLAADSAVTITTQTPQGNNYKILNSANKLFALSKYAPVGLMIYGNASLLGIPWETIIKMYRESLADKQFPSLTNYCDDLFKFLDKFNVPNTVQQKYVLSGAAGLYNITKKNLEKWVKEIIQTQKTVTPTEVAKKLKELITSQHNEFLKLGDSSVLSKTKRKSLQKQYRSIIRNLAKDIFEKLPLTQQLHSYLLSIAVNAASIGQLNQSGIVIAGFGTKDLFPSCHSFDVAGVFAGKTIKRDGKKHEISHEMGAAIIPFAQSDDVNTFMEGIGPTLANFLKDSFYSIMVKGLPDGLRDEISKKLSLDKSQKTELYKIAQNMCKGACDYAFQELMKQQHINYIVPVVQATGFLSKSELATMAETLVNLVSFRKQVTMEAETVGGPIDVAVVTKGDGLVWIKRKHYFPSELNHHFFTNYK